MKSTLFYRIASGLLAFFAVAHTFGMFSEEEGDLKAVGTAMRTVHFDAMGSDRTVMDFYMGFGFLFTMFLLYSAVLSWQLSGLVRTSPRLARTLGWPFAFCLAAVAILSWTNFFLAPQIVSTVAAVFLTAAVWLSRDPNTSMPN